MIFECKIEDYWYFALFYSIFSNLLVPELIINGSESLILANFEELFIGTVNMSYRHGIVFLATNGLSFTDNGAV